MSSQLNQNGGYGDSIFIFDLSSSLQDKYRRIADSHSKYNSTTFHDDFLWHQEWIDLSKRWEEVYSKLENFSKNGSNTAGDESTSGELTR